MERKKSRIKWRKEGNEIVGRNEGLFVEEGGGGGGEKERKEKKNEKEDYNERIRNNNIDTALP